MTRTVAVFLFLGLVGSVGLAGPTGFTGTAGFVGLPASPSVLLAAVSDPSGERTSSDTAPPVSDQFLSAVEEGRLNSGVPSLPSYAWAYYRLGTEARSARSSGVALKAFAAAAELDPNFLDPRFSLFRAYLFSNPSRSVAELSGVVNILSGDFLAQYFLFKNLAVMAFLVLVIALAAFAAMAFVRHISDLRHAIAERLSAEMPPGVAGWLGVFAVLQPVLWGLGLAGTVLCCSGAVWRSMNKREKFFTCSLLLLAVSAPLVSAELGKRFPPLGYESTAYVTYTAMRDGWSEGLERALLRSIQNEPDDAMNHFAYGTMARKAAKLGIARKELEKAVELSPTDARYMNNLGNVYFNLGDFDTADRYYRRAASAAPNLPEPHYNLAQIYTKRLLFAEANAEIGRAKELDAELINQFSLNSREQLNRSVIDSDLPASRYWDTIFKEGALARGSDAIEPYARFLGVGGARRSITVSVFFALCLAASVAVFRNLRTYKCANCGKTVCRKCLSRVQKQAYCLKCAVAASSVKSTEFTKLLLANQAQLETRRTRPVSELVGAVLPGFSLVQAGYALSGFLITLLWTAVALCIATGGYLVDFMPSLPHGSPGVVTYSVLLAPAILFHTLSVVWVRRRARSQVPSLRVIRPETTGKSDRDGVTGKSRRIQSG
jgi:tetratricopeptide (TPR) repeat protein